MRLFLLIALCLLSSFHGVLAEKPDNEAIRKAVTKGLSALALGTEGFENKKSCFTCHNQTLPMLAQATAQKHGFSIRKKILEEQTRFTHEFFQDREDSLKKGTGIGGRSMTVAYGLWALDVVDWKQDDTTQAMVAYLLKTQKEDGSYFRSKTRAPLEDSPATSATIASYFLQKFAPPNRTKETKESIERSRKWLLAFKPTRQEDFNSRLWGLSELDGPKEEIEKARQAILDRQRKDGGWSQLSDMESDSYATGQALWMLQETGTSASSEAYQRGVAYLLKTQREDGSWFVATRSKPIQTHFESGFPYGKDQFIAICGTSWAVAALAATQVVVPANSP